MATMETISDALKLIPEKKSLLRQAFEDLQSHSSSLSSFSLSWSDLDSHFSALQSTLEAKYKLLQSQPPDPIPEPQPVPKNEPTLLVTVNGGADVASVAARPKLKAFCENMDGLGLRNYISNLKANERPTIKNELLDAFKYASDAASMVLDALDAFFVPNAKKGKDFNTIKLMKSCIVIFEGLMESKVVISPEVRERAKSLALDWKEKVSPDDSSFIEAHGFLYLVACYGLLDVFSIDNLFDLAVVVASKYVEAVPLIRELCFGDKISELVQKIISKGKPLQAVGYIMEFELADKFPPITLLQDYVNEAKTIAEKIQKDGKHTPQSLNTATMKETSALNYVLTIIEDCKIEADMLKQSIIERLRELEKQKNDRKKNRPLKKLSGIKRPRVLTPAKIPNTVAFASSGHGPPIPTYGGYAVPPHHQSHQPW